MDRLAKLIKDNEKILKEESPGLHDEIVRSMHRGLVFIVDRLQRDGKTKESEDLKDINQMIYDEYFTEKKDV